MPERLTVDQWSNLVKWDIERVENWPRLVHIATGAPIDLLKEAEHEALELAIVFIATLMNARKETKCKDFNELKFGEWVDIEVYISFGVDKKLIDIMKVLDSETQWADEALWLYEKYHDYRMYVYNSYKTLFALDEQREIEELIEDDTPIDPMQIAKGWYRTIVGLAGDDILNIDGVVEQGVLKVLNFMALQKEKQQEEQERLRQQKRQYDLQRTSR
jgi:hypothetical protein